MSETIDPSGDSHQAQTGASNVGKDSKWQHALLVLLFALIYQISEIVFGAVTLFQVVCMLVTDDRNERLNQFSTWLTKYMYLVLQYVCLNSSITPWPLDKPESRIEIIQE